MIDRCTLVCLIPVVKLSVQPSRQRVSQNKLSALVVITGFEMLDHAKASAKNALGYTIFTRIQRYRSNLANILSASILPCSINWKSTTRHNLKFKARYFSHPQILYG